MAATLICFSCIIPPVLIGAAGKVLKVTSDDVSLILPETLKEVLPSWVALVALAAVCAAAMSSVDSSLLSGASYLSHNVFSAIIWPSANEKVQVGIFRIIIVVLGVASTYLSSSTTTINGLWFMAGDFGYVVVFPQFLAAVHLSNHVNVVGSVAAALVAIIFRALIGEPLLGIEPVMQTTSSDGNLIFPVKTVIMVASFLTLILVSKLYIKLRSEPNITSTIELTNIRK